MMRRRCVRAWFVGGVLIALLGMCGCPKPTTEKGRRPPATTTQPATEQAVPPQTSPAEAPKPESTPAPAEAEKPPAVEKPQAEAAAQPTAPGATAQPEMQPAGESQSQAPQTPPAAEPTSDEKPAGQAQPVAQGTAAQGTPFELKVPLGLPPLPIPEDNPLTVEKVELGKMLYFDKRVSADGTISCATCHDPKMAWAEHTPTSKGIHGQIGSRNAPTVINAAYAACQFWDGRAKTLEEQAVGPVENPIEMGHTLEGMVQTLKGIPQYEELFRKVFGTGVTAENFAKAVAAFERTILSGNSPYDRYRAGDQSALTEAQRRGLKVFEEAGCADCHTPPLFSNYEFYNAGVGMNKEKPDEGRKAVTGKDEDFGKFRVPSLREVANTAPYFHDGSAATLEEAVALMAAGGIDNPHRSAEFDTVREAKITPEQQKDLVEFLKALSGEFPVVEPPQLP